MTTPTPPSAEGAPATTTPADRSADRPPSPTWYGGLTIGLLWVMAAILLTYTLLDIPWQQRLGAWNYVIAVALIPVLSVLMRRWQPNTDRHFSSITSSTISPTPASRPEAGGPQR